MNDTITVCGIVATEPRHLVTETGIAITSMRLASPSRRWDRGTSSWANGPTNWYTVTAFRSLAANVHKSVKKGDRIVVTGRVRIRNWERDGRGGTSVEVDAEAIGHDLAWGISNWIRVPRHVNDSPTGHGPGAPGPTVDPQTGEVTEHLRTDAERAQVVPDEHEVGHGHDLEPDAHPDALTPGPGLHAPGEPSDAASGAPGFVPTGDAFESAAFEDGDPDDADDPDGIGADPRAAA